ncbi:hypothetical protein ACGO3R_08855 [Lactococcus lactis]
MIIVLAIMNAATSVFIIAMLFVILVGIYGALTVTKKYYLSKLYRHL